MPLLLTGAVPSSFPLRADGVGLPPPGAETRQASTEIDPPCRRSLHRSQARRTPLIAPGPDGCWRKDLVPDRQPTSSGPAEGRRFTGTGAGPGGSGPRSTPHHAGTPGGMVADPLAL